jgi:hypothetical protein
MLNKARAAVEVSKLRWEGAYGTDALSLTCKYVINFLDWTMEILFSLGASTLRSTS